MPEGEVVTDPRALDALLAEHLFGLKNVSYRMDPCGAAITGGPEKELFHGPRRGGDLLLDAIGPPGTLVHRYSSSWEGLGLVVEAMRAKGHIWFNLKTGDERWVGGRCAASFDPDSRDDDDAWSSDDSPPMAVALAALRALGVEVE